jgi:protein PET100
MFPIGIMYYFGTNLDERFAVPGFWPKAEHSHKIPFEREDIKNEYVRLTLRQRQFEAMKREREGVRGEQNNNEGSSA